MWKVGGQDVKRWEVEQPHAKSTQASHTEVEREYRGILSCKPSVESTQHQTSHCYCDSGQCDATVSKAIEESGCERTGGKSKESKEGRTDCCLGSTDMEAGSKRGEEDCGGVDGAPAEEGEGKGGDKNQERWQLPLLQYCAHCKIPTDPPCYKLTKLKG